MAVLTITMTVPDSHATMLEKLEMNATQVSLSDLAKVVDDVVNGAQKALVVVDLDGSPVVTVPA
jgi:ketopantoate hydroxymethyltransferase